MAYLNMIMTSKDYKELTGNIIMNWIILVGTAQKGKMKTAQTTSKWRKGQTTSETQRKSMKLIFRICQES